MNERMGLKKITPLRYSVLYILSIFLIPAVVWLIIYLLALLFPYDCIYVCNRGMAENVIVYGSFFLGITTGPIAYSTFVISRISQRTQWKYLLILILVNVAVLGFMFINSILSITGMLLILIFCYAYPIDKYIKNSKADTESSAGLTKSDSANN